MVIFPGDETLVFNRGAFFTIGNYVQSNPQGFPMSVPDGSGNQIQEA